MEKSKSKTKTDERVDIVSDPSNVSVENSKDGDALINGEENGASTSDQVYYSLHDPVRCVHLAYLVLIDLYTSCGVCKRIICNSHLLDILGFLCAYLLVVYVMLCLIFSFNRHKMLVKYKSRHKIYQIALLPVTMMEITIFT